MKILHLFGDWKWTGPAEPVLNICIELKNFGHEVFLSCKNPPDDVNQGIVFKAKEKNFPLTNIFHLNKYFNFFD